MLTLAAGLICRQDRKDSLVSLTNRPNLAPRISGEPVSSGARVASGFRDHVRLDGVEAGKLVGQRLSRVATQHNSFLQQQDGFLRGGRYLIDARRADGNLLFDDVAVWCAIASSVFLRLRVNNTDDTEFDFRRLNTLIAQKLHHRFLVGLGFGVECGEIIAGLFVG